jgi:hypothetical protein
MDSTMLFPGSFIWRRISGEWLVSRMASALFAACCVLIAVMTAVLYRDDQLQDIGSIASVLLGVGGMACSVGIFFLWGGMWRYWMTGKPSNRAARRLWFLLLIVGVWYGAILYYVFVYLPASRRMSRECAGGLAR